MYTYLIYESICNEVGFLLPPHNQYHLSTESDKMTGHGFWIITDTIDNHLEDDCINKDTIGEETTLIRLLFMPDYLEIETMLIGYGHPVEFSVEKIFYLLLEKAKELKVPLVIREDGVARLHCSVKGIESKMNVTRIDTRTPFKWLMSYIISEPELQEQHDIIAKKKWEVFCHKSKMYTKDEYANLIRKEILKQEGVPLEVGCSTDYRTMATKDDATILLEGQKDFIEHGTTDVKCPQCGKQLEFLQRVSGSVIRCIDESCIQVISRGI